MAQPNSKSTLVDYCKRRLGSPVLEINVDSTQIDDAIDDALQYYRERHFDGVERMYLKHQFTDADKTKFSTPQTQTDTINSTDWERTDNYLDIPPHVVGISKVFGLNSNTIRNNLFGLEYQIFLNDLYAFGSLDILNYFMIKQYLETMDMVLNNGSFIEYRFNQRQDRLYLDIDWQDVTADEFIVIECYRKLDPATYVDIWNDIFLKKYATQLIKKQWGANLSKFQGVQMLGGVVLNGEQIYTQAQEEINKLEEQMQLAYELPPMHMIG